MTALLVIESNPTHPSSLSKRLEKEGFQIFSTSRFELSMKLSAENPVELIVCEHNLEKLDGLKNLQIFSQSKRFDTLPKIIVSEVGDRATFRSAMALGADDFIPQPYDFSEIIEAIYTQLKRVETLQQRHSEFGSEEAELKALCSQAELKKYFESLQRQESSQKTNLYLITIDQLNWFRSTSGSQFSQKVLDIFASRLIETNQSLNNAFRLASIDGQQFAILACHGQEKKVNGTLNQSWQQNITLPIRIQEQEILVTTSIASVEVNVETNPDFESVMGQARRLTKRINKQGGNQFITEKFRPSSKSNDQFAIATNLLKGLTEEEFHAYYQPQVDLKTGRFVGVEALVRWHHHEWGVLEPGRFIPVAEETAIIMQIDERVLRLACQAMQRWNQKGYEKLTVSVNLSAVSFNRPNLSEVVQDIIREYEVSPELIELEITESMLMQDAEKAAHIMKDLKAVGVSLALDDFGVGYSSLSYLQQFPLDTLKIDQCFVQKVDSNRGNAAITEAVLKLAHSLNLKVIAEGVERVAEREYLKTNNCDVMQGYLISPPVPRSVFETFLAAQSKTPVAA